MAKSLPPSRTFPRIFSWTTLLILLFSAAAQARKGPKIPVGDDPTLGERGAPWVLIEIADFQ